MTATPDDFVLSTIGAWDGPDSRVSARLDTDRLRGLIAGPDPTHPDVDIALALLDLVRDELTAYGTGQEAQFSENEIRLAIRALERTATRAGVVLELPFRDCHTWRTYWLSKNASYSYQARRDLLSQLFDPPLAKLMAEQDRRLEARLATPVSPRARIGWPTIDEEIEALRKGFARASTAQDYRAIGNDCVHIVEKLSAKVYVHQLHGGGEDPEPHPSQTKVRFSRYIEARLPGPGNSELRKFARSVIELAQATKHVSAPSRTQAGITADAVIILANLFRRLSGPD